MKMLKCCNCGSPLEMKDSSNKFVCPSCGTTIILEETNIDYKKYKLKHREKMKKQEAKDDRKIMTMIAAFIIGLFVLLFAMMGILDYTKPQNVENRRLTAITKRVQQLIVDKKYDEAIVEVQTIRAKKNGIFDSNYDKWENIRNGLIELINEKK